MARNNDTSELNKLLLDCMLEEDPMLTMLTMLEWLCNELMEAEVCSQVGFEKSQHTKLANPSAVGYRPRRLDTRMELKHAKYV